MQSFAGPDWGLVTARPRLFVGACITYFTAAILLGIARRLHWSSLSIVALGNASVDALAIGLILYGSGGSASGLGILLVLPVFALTVLADRRDALLIAAAAALAVLVQQVFVGVSGSAPSADYVTAGVFGAVLFLVALATGPVATRLRQSEAVVRRQEVDLANMAQLSQYIVQHLRESILVLDEQDRIRLINESAAQILGDQLAVPDALIGEACPRLLYLLESWRKSGAHGSSVAPEPTFVAAARAGDVCGGRRRAHRSRPFCTAGEQSRAGAHLSRGYESHRREGPAIEARGPRALEREHRARDPQSRRRHESRGAAAGRVAAPGG